MSNIKLKKVTFPLNKKKRVLVIKFKAIITVVALLIKTIKYQKMISKQKWVETIDKNRINLNKLEKKLVKVLNKQ